MRPPPSHHTTPPVPALRNATVGGVLYQYVASPALSYAAADAACSQYYGVLAWFDSAPEFNAVMLALQADVAGVRRGRGAGRGGGGQGEAGGGKGVWGAA